MRENGRCLPQTHVERKASAEFVRGEKVDPRQRLCLIGAQRSGEALRGDIERDFSVVRTVDDLLRPTVAVHDDLDPVPRAVEADALSEDFGAGQFRDRLAFGQRGSGTIEIEPIDRHPPAV